MSTMTPSRRSHSVRLMRNDEAFTRSLQSPLRLESSARKYLEPLQTMAERVGKDVEIFAEKLDQWYNTTRDSSPLEKYNKTVTLVSQFQQHANKKVKELEKREAAANRGDLAKDVKKRIESMANTPRNSLGPEGDEGSTNSMSTNFGTPEKLQDLRHWQNEAATWDLLRIIIDLYHPKPGFDRVADTHQRYAAVHEKYASTPDLEIWNQFLVLDPPALEKSKILQWLEKSADSNQSDIKSITEQLEADSGKSISNWTSGWLDTKSKIKAEKRLRQHGGALHPDDASIKSADRTQVLVTQLDPDAPSRQKRALVKSDDYYERAIWMTCYEMLRRGKPWAEICEWCRDHSESWRAVSMGLTTGSREDAPTCLTGPYLGSLWRRTCYALAQGSEYRYERAAYGLLSGDLASVEEVCRTWDDHLYARYNALLLSRFEAFLQAKHPDKLPPSLSRKFTTFDAVSFHGDWPTSNERVIELLKEHKNIKKHANSPTKLIQGSLISRTFDDLVYQVGAMVAGRDNEEDFRLNPSVKLPELGTPASYYDDFVEDQNNLRVIVHMILVFKALGIPPKNEELVDNIIIKYIKLLQQARRFKVIPTYAAQVEPERQVSVLSLVLPSIGNAQEQKGMCRLIQDVGVDPMAVIATNYMVATMQSGLLRKEKYIKRYNMLESPTSDEYLWPGQRTKKDFLNDDIAPAEKEIIESLEWYMHVNMHMAPTFISLTDAMKAFFLNGSVAAALELFHRLPVEVVCAAKSKPYFGQPLNFLDPDGELEQEALQSADWPKSAMHIDAPDVQFGEYVQNQFKMWTTESRVYIELCQLATAIEALSKWRAHEDVCIRAKEEGKKIPTKKIKELFEKIVEAIGPLLNGFLTQSEDDEEAFQLERLRHAYLPDLLLAYNSTIQASAHFVSRELATKSMDLATAIADDANAELADAFVKTGRMEELVTAFAMTSKAMVTLGERAPRGGGKKRGWLGESSKIWDLNVRN